MRNCINCGEALVKRHQIKFCSNKCQGDYRYKTYIKLWEKGIVDGNMGITARGMSRHIKRFFIEKFGNKCVKCGWNKKHPSTQNIPLEIDHIDGDSENNLEKNLQLLCPNCHALTPFFKNLNKGKGRKWRVNKYIKNT